MYRQEQDSDRCPGDVIIHTPHRTSKVVTAKIYVVMADNRFQGVCLSYRRGLCSLFVQRYRANARASKVERQREVHAFLCLLRSTILQALNPYTVTSCI